MRRWLFPVIVLFGLLALAACAAKEKAAPAPAPPAPEVAPAWQEEWERVLAAAKREGKVAVAGPAGAERRQALTEPFEKKYGITVEFRGFVGPAFPERLRAERAAGQHLWDLFIGGSTSIVTVLKPMGALDPIEPHLILPEVTEGKHWRGGKLGFNDKDKMVMGMTHFTSGTWFVSPRLVDPKEFKSWKDLLDPKWKGKILMHDPRIAGTGQSRLAFFYMHPQLGPDFIRALAPQVVINRDYGVMNEWIATGRYPINIAASEPLAEAMIEKGAPMARVEARLLKEGGYLASGASNVALINRAPHPNAAKLYLNWLLGKEGQTEFSKASGYASRRLDVPTDHLAPTSLPVEGYIDTDVEEAVLLRVTKIAELAKELFGN